MEVLSETMLMTIQMLLGGVGGAFMLGCAWFALKAKIETNRVANEAIRIKLQDHEAECERRQERVWAKLDKVSESLARIEGTLEHMKR